VSGRCSNRTQSNKIKVVAYAVDITILVTRPEEFNAIQQVIGQCVRASGACLNPAKSKALAIGSWTLPARQLDIPFQKLLKILGIIFSAKTKISGTHNLINIVQTVREQVNCTYVRKLCLAQRVQYVNTFLLAKQFRTNLDTKSTLLSATCNDMQVVHMAKCHLPGTSTYPPSTETKGRLGSNPSFGQI
jgi:hypothetical protein